MNNQILSSGSAHQPTCTAFEGTRRIASGPLPEVARKVKAVLDRGERGPVLIFDDATSEIVEVDFRGTPEDVAARLTAQPGTDIPASPPTVPEVAAPRKPGRPRLGVVAREVTLLPRHWEWLNCQPGGASVALRKLVEQARRGSESKDRVRRAQESAYRFMSAMAGNEAGFEEALRCLFAGDEARFHSLIDDWPIDVRDHARKLAAEAFTQEG
ncbi:MAG: DUF2239 family protein [Bryobacteraceae bacterium]|nr:DUF2239 family protein [Bryobacteraceae bacterium]